MNRFLGFGSSRARNTSSQSLTALDEPQQLEDALRASLHIMNDDIDAAEKHLEVGSSAFHKLGLGITTFLRATISSEKELMREAGTRLADAETMANDHHYRAQKGSRVFHSQIYPAGAEFALCAAEAQVMAAFVGVLNESVADAFRGFYKLRKSFNTLNGLLDAENKYIAQRKPLAPASESSALGQVADGHPVAPPREPAHYVDPFADDRRDEDLDEFYDAADIQSNIAEAKHNGGGEVSDTYHSMSNLSMGDSAQEDRSQISAKPLPELPGRLGASTYVDKLLAEAPDVAFFSNPIDMFVHSGVNLHFGILQLMISMIPPSFSKLLNIVGFRGDRERGIKLLWQATCFDDINGAMAGLILTFFYNAFILSIDILPSEGAAVYPKDRCVELLQTMRQRYPNSGLWLLQEASGLAADRQLEKASLMLTTAPRSQLKQVEALMTFENSLNFLFLHEYEKCADSFLKCMKLSSWSRGMYSYIAGCAHLELYRLYKYGCPFPVSQEEQSAAQTDVKMAEHHAKRAEDLLQGAAEHLGKKKFMSRKLPFDIFVQRKLNKWEARSKEWEVRLVDAIGVSPCEEMTFFWSGYAKMRREHMAYSLARLAWSDGCADFGSVGRSNPHWSKEDLDEHAILAVLRATIHRQSKQTQQAKKILSTEIIDTHKPEEFKGGFKDTWTAPIARYEMAVNCWEESKAAGGQKDSKSLQQCSSWLEKVAAWESYDLDARLGVKVSIARSTLRDLGVGPGC